MTALARSQSALQEVKEFHGKDRYSDYRSWALWLVGSSPSSSRERCGDKTFRRADVLLGASYAKANVSAFALGRLPHRRSRKPSGIGCISDGQRKHGIGLSHPSTRFHQLWPLVP